MNEWLSTRYDLEGWLKPRNGLHALACLAAVLGVACVAQVQPPPGAYRPDKDTAVTPVNQRPDANQVLKINSAHVQQQNFAAANAERKRQLSLDSARLLQIAADLNREIAQGGSEAVSAAAASKVGMIEQLAHAVKEKMKLTVASQ